MVVVMSHVSHHGSRFRSERESDAPGRWAFWCFRDPKSWRQRNSCLGKTISHPSVWLPRA